jgi:hypothetical protein
MRDNTHLLQRVLCMYVTNGRARARRALAKIYCASSSCLSICQSYAPNAAQNFPYEGVTSVAWFHETVC